MIERLRVFFQTTVRRCDSQNKGGRRRHSLNDKGRSLQGLGFWVFVRVYLGLLTIAFCLCSGGGQLDANHLVAQRVRVISP